MDEVVAGFIGSLSEMVDSDFVYTYDDGGYLMNVALLHDIADGLVGQGLEVHGVLADKAIGPIGTDIAVDKVLYGGQVVYAVVRPTCGNDDLDPMLMGLTQG